MPEVDIRPAIATDVAALLEIDHSYHTSHVWQMDIRNGDAQVGVSFRQIRLPRSMRVEYPRNYRALEDDWVKRSALLVAEGKDEVLGYVSLMTGIAPGAVWITDLVVLRRMRRHGIGTALLMAAKAWAKEQSGQRLVLEMQSKNYPAICLANKMGFEFCGYSDRYYTNQDIALFFARRLQ